MPYRYVIVGGGLAAASAIEGIRSQDSEGSILLMSRENHLPYQRPPLTKELWYGALKLDALPLHPDEWYVEQKVEVHLRQEVVEIDPDKQVVWPERGESIEYGELLLATGCRPRRLSAQGAETSNVRYFRDLEDYLDLEGRLDLLQHATIVGGWFTAVDLALALRSRRVEVTLVLPDEYPLYRMLPREIGMGLLDFLREQEIEIVSDETLVRIDEAGGMLRGRTYHGNDLDTQLVLVDQGCEPVSDLAEAAGLDIDDGVVVDEYGHASKPHVWAAGDVAEFPYLALGMLRRVEGTDHAEHHGRTVGANMAGANRAYGHLPLKWFRVGDLLFEGVGELSTRMHTEIVWLEPGREGVVYYVEEEVVRGVMLINAHDRIEWARGLVRDTKQTSAAERASMAGAKA